MILAERAGFPDSRVVREKAKEQISARDRERAEALAKTFKPTLERPVDAQAPQLYTPAAKP